MKSIIAFCKPFLRAVKGALLVHIGTNFLAGICTVVLPYLTGLFIDQLLQAQNVHFIWNYALLFLVIGGVQILAGYLGEQSYITAQMRSSVISNAQGIYQVQNTTSQFIQGKDTATLNRQINNDACDTIIFTIQVLHELPTNLLTLGFALVVLTMAQPWLGVVMVGINLAYFGIYQLLRKPLYQRHKAATEALMTFFGRMDEQLSNVKFLQIHGISRKFVDRLSSHGEVCREKLKEETNVSYWFPGTDTALKAIANVLVFFIGGTAVIRGELTIGTFTILMSYITMSMTATHYFFQLGKEVQENLVAKDRLQEIFDLKPQTTGPQTLGELDTIQCQNLTFGYREEPVLRDLSLRLEKGKIYSLVGENGAGKSTLIQTILGIFVDEYQGEITYNGIPVEQLDMPQIREKLVGVSEQEPDLLPETLRFNLTLDDEKEISQQDFHAITTMLGMEEMLSHLPQGLDTPIVEGTANLSGGEKQKVSLVRALLKHPQLLILDEPTSALDKQSRENLCRFLQENKEDKIVILSTHDQALLDISDEIIPITNQKKLCS